MRDLGVGEIGVFRRRPNAQCHTPSRILHGIWAVGRLRGGLRGGLWVAGWVVVCVAERAWRRGDGRRGILLCALVSGSKAEAATASRLPQSGRHDRVHSDPPAASHPRTGGRRRSRRVATPLRGTISTCGFGYVTCSCLLLQDYATVTRRLAAARTARSKGAQATWPMCQNDDNSALRGPSRL